MSIYSILILDDGEVLLAYYNKLFKDELPYQVSITTVKDGDGAYRILKESNGNFNLMITDILHTGMSTFELIAFIREEFPKMKVLISSSALEMFSQDKLSLADAVIAIPFTNEKLLDVVSRLLIG